MNDPVVFIDNIFDADEWPVVLARLLVAVTVGMILGLNRDLKGKPTGMRTLGLVALGAALVGVTAVHHDPFEGHPDALSRAVQGAIQGVMAGVGFIGAGVILRDPRQFDVQHLTTAATVWTAAALGLACALAAWHVVVTGVSIALVLLIVGGPLERRLARLVGADRRREDEADLD